MVENNVAETTFKSEIEFDDFMKMDIRIAKILEAEKVPKTDKLLKLTLDVGSEKKTVVAGIAVNHKPEDIIGKQVAYLFNLKGRKLRGIESSGMVLMVEDKSGKLVFLTPEDEVNNGSKIS